MKQEQSRFIQYLFIARRMCAAFAVAGTIGVFCLGTVLVDRKTGILAAAIWAFNPITLGYGAILSSDISGASVGCWAIFAAYLSLKKKTIQSMIWTFIAQFC